MKAKELEKRADKTSLQLTEGEKRSWGFPVTSFCAFVILSFHAQVGRSEIRGCMSVLFQCKCAQYWPDQGCWTYGNIRVSVEDVTVLVDYTVRKFCIQQVLSPTSFLGSCVGSADH